MTREDRQDNRLVLHGSLNLLRIRPEFSSYVSMANNPLRINQHAESTILKLQRAGRRVDQTSATEYTVIFYSTYLHGVMRFSQSLNITVEVTEYHSDPILLHNGGIYDFMRAPKSKLTQTWPPNMAGQPTALHSTYTTHAHPAARSRTSASR